MKNRLIFLVGPTAIGKSEIAVKLARKLGGEIISCDSMQIYKGMDIITSCPSKALKKKTRHHLIGVIRPTATYNVSRYFKEALVKIKGLFEQGKIPLLTGGTGLYMSILLDGIFEAKTEDKALRKKMYEQARKQGSEYLYNRLRKVDPVAASKIHPNDTRRIVRAREVFKVTGRPISGLQKDRKGLWGDYDIRIFCLDMGRKELYNRIDERVEKMFRQGLVREVKRLLKLRLGRTAKYAIGIRELKGYFDGLYDLDEAKRLIKRNTRLFAKRQLTWFRKDKRIEWINIEEGEGPAEAADKIWKELYS